MRIKNCTTDLVFFLFADHLGSTNVTSDPSGLMVSLNLYKPWGDANRLRAKRSMEYLWKKPNGKIDSNGRKDYQRGRGAKLLCNLCAFPREREAKLL